MNWVLSLTKNLKNRLKAISTIELLTAVSVFAIVATMGYQVFSSSIRTVQYAQDYAQAELLARDLLELTTAMRNEDWNALAAGEYYFTESGGDYSFTAGTETVGKFTRSVTISTVERDGSGDIVASGGTVDTDIYKATAVVTWSFNTINFNVTLNQYLSNWRRF